MIFKPPISKETSSAVVEFLRIKLGLNKKLMLLFSSALLGVIVAAAAIAFTFILHAVKDGAAAIPFLEANAYLKPALGGLAVGIIVFLILRKPQGGGVEETIKMIKVDYKTTGLRHAIVRLLTSSITLGSGGSAGKEGPAVNIGGIVGSLLGRLLPFPESYVRTLIGAGAAAGIASAFQAPIAGAFFALEILLADFTLDTFSMIVVASVASTAVTQSFGDYSRHLKVPDYSFNDPIELLFYAAMGVAGGLIAVFFIRTLHASEEFFKRSPLPRFLKPALGGLLLGALAMIIPEIFGEGYQLINMTMAGKADELLGQYRLADYLGIAGILSVVMVAKIFGTAFTLGSGGSGGTIIPALFIGAIVGSIMAEITSYFFPELKISPGTWAMVGMGSVLAAMTQGPLFSITLFFEITRNYEVILPVVVVVTTSILVSKHFLKGSLYSISLRREGIRLYQGMEQSIMEEISVQEVMHKDVNLVNSNVTLGSLIQGFLHTDYSAGFVVSKTGKYLGIVTIDDVKEYIEERELFNLLLASELARHPDIWLTTGMSLLEGLELMDRHDMIWLPVLADDGSHKPVAYITRKDIISVYSRELTRRGTQSMMLETTSAARPGSLAIAENLQIESLVVPKKWAGKTLKELDLRARYNLTVIGIRRPETEGNIIPDVNYQLRPQDQLTLVGTFEDIDLMLAELQKGSKFLNLFRRGSNAES